MKGVFACFTEQCARVVPGSVGNTGPGEHSGQLIHPAGFREELNLRVVIGIFMNKQVVMRQSRYLRRVGDTNDLGMLGDCTQQSSDDIGGGATNPNVCFIQDQAR